MVESWGHEHTTSTKLDSMSGVLEDLEAEKRRALALVLLYRRCGDGRLVANN